MEKEEMIEAMEDYLSDSYERDGEMILFFEYVPEELWEKIKAALSEDG